MKSRIQELVKGQCFHRTIQGQWRRRFLYIRPRAPIKNLLSSVLHSMCICPWANFSHLPTVLMLQSNTKERRNKHHRRPSQWLSGPFPKSSGFLSKICWHSSSKFLSIARSDDPDLNYLFGCFHTAALVLYYLYLKWRT